MIERNKDAENNNSDIGSTRGRGIESEVRPLPDRIGERSETADLPEIVGERSPVSGYQNELQLEQGSDLRKPSLENSDLSQRRPEMNNYKAVWSEMETPTKEMHASGDNVFSKMHVMQESAEINDKYYHDDTGKVYRIGDELLPECRYEKNGYSYETDDLGRVDSVKGNLHIKDREGRLPIKDSMDIIGKGDQLETDDRGHLIGDQFDGPNGMENLIPQDANINRSEYKNLENQLAKELKAGKTVYVDIDVVYEGDSRRPEAILCSYTVDGKENMDIFLNNREDG